MTTDDEANPGRRPADDTPEIGSTICERLMDRETLREICADPAMPDKATVLRWLAEHEEFRDEYAFAREVQADDLLVEVCAIVDNARSGCLERVRGAKVVTVSGRHALARTRLHVEIRWWVAARLMPKTIPQSVS
jgi:hypothetical protein